MLHASQLYSCTPCHALGFYLYFICHDVCSKPYTTHLHAYIGMFDEANAIQIPKKSWNWKMGFSTLICNARSLACLCLLANITQSFFSTHSLNEWMKEKTGMHAIFDEFFFFWCVCVCVSPTELVSLFFFLSHHMRRILELSLSIALKDEEKEKNERLDYIEYSSFAYTICTAFDMRIEEEGEARSDIEFFLFRFLECMNILNFIWFNIWSLLFTQHAQL